MHIFFLALLYRGNQQLHAMPWLLRQSRLHSLLHSEGEQCSKNLSTIGDAGGVTTNFGPTSFHVALGNLTNFPSYSCSTYVDQAAVSQFASCPTSFGIVGLRLTWI